MTNNGFVKGITVGVIAGTAIGLVVTPKSRNVKKTAAKMLRTAGDVVENISGLWH